MLKLEALYVFVKAKTDLQAVNLTRQCPKHAHIVFNTKKNKNKVFRQIVMIIKDILHNYLNFHSFKCKKYHTKEQNCL